MLFSNAIPTYSLYLASNGFSPHTVKYYAGCMKRVLKAIGDRPVAAIQYQDLVLFMADVSARGRSQNTLRAYWKSFRSFFSWAQLELGLKELPNAKIKCPAEPPTEVIPFTQEDVQALLKAAEYTRPAVSHGRKSFQMKRATAARDIALVKLLLDTGLRVSEAARLTVGDVDLFDNCAVQVHAYRSGKKSRPRTVFISRRTAYQIHRYLSTRDKPHNSEPLFLSIKNNPMDRDSIRHLLDNLGTRADVPNTHPHRFRHTFAIEFLRNGGNVYTLQRLLGHSTLDMVRRYLHLSEVDIENAHRLASPVDNWRL
ncbi:MAG: tyrosine-type recombinase/integrase [Anaerolineae bacterium]|nr:tyrosine-type recombinase/integrase [Anaerolineae bacterium]